MTRTVSSAATCRLARGSSSCFSLDDKPHDIPIRRQARYESAFWNLPSRCAGSPDPDAGSTQPWNYGLYFVADQMVYRVTQSAPGLEVGNSDKQTTAPSITDKGLGVFTHIAFCPPNSSLINFYIDSGLNHKGLIPTRDNDVLGVAFAYGHLNNNPKNAEENSFPGYEIAIEATYQIELTPWFSLQPDLQYVLHPSGTDIANALVLGARATISF